MGEQVWLYVGLVVIGITGLVFVVTAVRGGCTRAGLVVGLAHLGIAWLNAAAPFRGALDPAYVGFGFGFLRAERGIGVTLLSGTLLACALASALVAVRGRPGRKMLAVTGTSLFFGWNVLFPLLASLGELDEARIQLGEFLTIPPYVTVPLMVLLFVVPFAWGARWSWRRAFA